MNRYLISLLLVFFTASEAFSQITIPNTFSPNTVAQSALVNANFSQVGSLALNRSGGNITGNITADGGVTIDGIDIGATICTTCDPTFDDLTLDTLAAVSATFSSTGAAAIDVAGGITAGTGNVAIVDTTGKIPAISSTYFASLSGANLTGLLEANIADGSILARVASAEIITGGWTIGNGATIGILAFNTPALSNSGITFAQDGVANGQIVQSNAGSFWDAPGTHTWRTVAGVTRASLTSAGLFTAAGGVTNQGAEINSNTISPGALSTGNNNNYAPTGITDAFLIRLDGGAGSPVLTGLSGGTAGKEVILCRVAGSGISITAEDANSSAANRFTTALTLLAVADGDCIRFVYDGTSQRWRDY
jgi:hypothetical protein